MNLVSTGDQSQSNPGKRNRWRLICAAGVLLVAAIAILGHRSILTTVARQLVVRDSSAGATHVLLYSGDRVERTAVEFLEQGAADECLLLSGQPSRIVQLGVLPPGAVLRQQELERHGVAADRISVLDFEGTARFDWARRVAQWLAENDDEVVVLLCDQFSSRELRAAIDFVAPEALARRVRIHPLRDRRFDETNWWTSRPGTRLVAGRYLSLAYCYLVGERENGRPHRTSDEYEEWFLELLPCGALSVLVE